MHRIMNAKTLTDYLASAHATVMLCRAHADNFALSTEEAADVHFQIAMHIADLETLCTDIQTKNITLTKESSVFHMA